MESSILRSFSTLCWKVDIDQLPPPARKKIVGQKSTIINSQNHPLLHPDAKELVNSTSEQWGPTPRNASLLIAGASTREFSLYIAEKDVWISFPWFVHRVDKWLILHVENSECLFQFVCNLRMYTFCLSNLHMCVFVCDVIVIVRDIHWKCHE